MGPILTVLGGIGHFSCCHHSLIHPIQVFARCPLCASNGSETGEIVANRTWALVLGFVALPVPEVVSQDMVLDHHTGIIWAGYLLEMQIPGTRPKLLNQNL